MIFSIIGSKTLTRFQWGFGKFLHGLLKFSLPFEIRYLASFLLIQTLVEQCCIRKLEISNVPYFSQYCLFQSVLLINGGFLDK